MSRFVLRSKEGTKLTEQKEKVRPSSNTLRSQPKKIDNKKNRNTINSKDSVPQDLVPSWPKKTSSGGDGDEDEKITPISMICSLPLSRLTGIIEKLSIKTPSKSINSTFPSDSKFTKPSATANGSNSTEEDDIKERDQEERQSFIEDDTSNSKSQDQLLGKVLCLYCDKKFSTHKMQLKHIEKFHTTLKDRRCSIRNSQLQTSPRNKSGGRQHEKDVKSANFPGCSYCKKTKTLETAESAIDFNGLFLHMTECHADKYFGCKICVMRFQNIAKLLKHMQNVHNTLPDAQLRLAKEFNNDSLDDSNNERASPIERHTRTKQRHIGQHECTTSTSTATGAAAVLSVLDQSAVIGAEEAILSRLGLTQNRRRNPSNRKGVRLRRDTSVPEILLKNDIATPGTSALNSSVSPSKSRSKATTKSTNAIGDSDSVLFRVPVRTDFQSAAFDESFYKEVTSNVRNNLLYHLDGKLGRRSHTSDEEATVNQDKTLPLLLRSTLASNVAIQEGFDSSLQESEIHVATNLPATTAFPTLLTAEQYCVDATSAKIRRPHTKHSWKWKWDSVKKYKLINEGGKIVKKAKHPMLGLRDLSKLDMWTQLSMRQKHEKQLSSVQDAAAIEECCSGEKRRLNDQLNSILDMRVLPHIILEQSEQAIIKLENDEFSFNSTYERHDEGDDFYTGNIVGQTFTDEAFLSLLQLLPRREARQPERKLVLSGEWARPRCYLCMCCGNKFEKLKSLEEHKMFRHSNILSTHYEVVGRELLAGNILQHLFIPKRALCSYSIDTSNALIGNSKSLTTYRRVNTSAEEESSDSIQSISNCYATQRTYSLKQTNSTTDDCDTDTKTTLLGEMNTVSPSHSLQSSFSSSLTPTSNLSQNLQKESKWKCSKCSRKCNSMTDLYRHMLDCSGDYVWSMAKKRKYRYYCGSKKRRPLHKQHLLESRRPKQEKPTKAQALENSTTEESSSNSYKPKTPPRPRPSDAESIKKMLENLPPKRICKKIFPTVNKARKTRKPTFITKLYNTKVLRKTRARQISNAAKRASTRFPGKSQIKNNALKTLRCKTTKNVERTKQRNPLPGAGNRSPKTTQSEKRNSPKKDPISASPKQEPKKMEPQQKSELQDIVVQDTPKEIEQSQNQNQNQVVTENVGMQQQITTPEVQEPIKITSEVKNTDDVSRNTIDKSNDLVTAPVVENVMEPPKTKAIENQACNRKRSKRISDCIAMLTGKLEEKLKTESTVNTKNYETVPTESSNTTSAEKAKTEETGTEKEKKTPKRKAISRRIIKPDVNDTTSSELDQQNISKTIIPTTVPPILTKTLSTSKRVISTAKETTATASITSTMVSVTSATLTTTTKLTTTKTKLIPPTSAPTPPSQPQLQLQSQPQQQTVVIPIQTAPISMPMTDITPNPQAKVVLPNAVINPTLVSIPIPIAPTMHAVPVPLKVLQNHLPVFIPVQPNVTTSANLTPRPALPIPLPTGANTAIMPTVALLPPPPPLLQAHVSPVLTSNASSPICSMEPLNLTSAKGPKRQITAELRAQRPGMPARRQTICGFEARDLISYNDMEPLDLSKKSRDPPVVSFQPLPPPISQPTVSLPHLAAPPAMPAVELLNASSVQPVALSQQVPQPAARIQIEEPATKPANMVVPPTLPTETVFNKQFYSNLELLKIPQIRATGFITANIPPNETVAVANGLNLNICSSTTNLPIPLKINNNKKRSNSNKVVVEPLTNKLITTPTAAPAAVTPQNKVKEHTGSNKKENVGKNKSITKMDEEVINHIDDAINSVINAVTASLPDNDEEEIALAKVTPAPQPVLIKVNPKDSPVNIIEKPQEEPVIIKEISMPVEAAPEIVMTPKKRTLRSKTLDCRSELARITRPMSRSEILYSPPLIDQHTQPSECAATKELSPNFAKSEKTEETQEEQSPSNQKEKKEMTPPVIEIIIEEPIEKSSDLKTPEKIPVVIDSTDSKKETASPIKTANENKAQIEPPLQESNVNLITEENMSNINNTSSGFHSSGTPESGGDVKKKQRRRRKNELAAIVADQLLESFKIDKARRDSLKKLENLAYEKSEDLLLTGMLLMSSTKRNASSGISFTQNSSEKRSENTKRSKQEVSTTAQVQAPKTRSKTNENLNKNTVQKAAERTIAEEIKEVAPRKNKRRQSRRKVTPLDNENLSKLKSSLESFSIGIEKQLSEIEARNTNVFQNTENKTRKNTEQSNTKPTSSILRPSILSATLEQVDNQKTADNGKATTTFSRDPRLNKNIHKFEQQVHILPNENNAPPPLCDLEDDNYLTEIAKNVNEKIMSAENEDFAFADDGFEIGNEYQDDSNSKFSRPPTSMSVRSAPNFNDDRSNFGSICDENTNTEVMDMDLDDELSVYTSFSQDLGRGRGRKRRRRRSILLKRRPKKRRASQDLTAEKFECELCKKTFFAATSLAKHNMTLAHVSKVSEREYLMSKSGKANLKEDKTKAAPKQSPLQMNVEKVKNDQSKYIDSIAPIIPTEKEKERMESHKEPINVNILDTSHRLSLNPDERLFFECCNILKSADTSRAVRGDNDNENQNSLAYPCMATEREEDRNVLQKPLFEETTEPKRGHAAKTEDTFRNPSVIPNSFNRVSSTIATTLNERQIQSPTHHTQFSAITNTTSRFKTKAAMKGYENGNQHVPVPDESKSRATCKLTELADIALGHDEPRTLEIRSNADQAIIGVGKRVVTPEYVTLSVVDSRRNCNYNAAQGQKKNTETQGSSSSRTIMHSSIIKAAVEEHSKPQPVNKIVIPERPFKNIGLEEKESITFQKPKTTVNLLLDDNSVSTASYSDRDDFDFGSMSCDDEASDKTLNDKNLKSNSSDSSSSRATAKTFENKSLIMGRIFKNASTKPKASVKSVGVQKDHTPKADLDQLFDELRGEGAPKPKIVENPIPRQDIGTTFPEVPICTEVKTTSIKTTTTTTTTIIAPPIPDPEPKRRSKTVPKKPKASKKSQKDLTKLQSELGMSQEEIEKLIDDGQRKSKRRCATNRSKKMVEMWSSDEYEEFLSTKDIIALIEEKEKQEQRKKRKNIAIPNATAVEATEKEKRKEKPTADTNIINESIVVSPNKKSAKLHNLNNEKETGDKEKTAATTLSSYASTPKDKARDKGKGKGKSKEREKKQDLKLDTPPEDSTNTSKASKTKKTKNTRQASNKGHKDTKVAEKAKNVTAKNVVTEATQSHTVMPSQAGERNLYLHDIKQNKNQTQTQSTHININNNNNNNNAKTKKDKSTKEDVNLNVNVNNFKSHNREATNADVAELKKRNATGGGSSSNNNNSSSNINKKNRGRRKAQTEKTPSRKRQASEKLYYWSSSSDEDFGRINDNEPEFENTEQYQKHGWIVGDSHKKLVTLLAIAKGNKKVESCGVKKNVSKRKS